MNSYLVSYAASVMFNGWKPKGVEVDICVGPKIDNHNHNHIKVNDRSVAGVTMGVIGAAGGAAALYGYRDNIKALAYEMYRNKHYVRVRKAGNGISINLYLPEDDLTVVVLIESGRVKVDKRDGIELDSKVSSDAIDLCKGPELPNMKRSKREYKIWFDPEDASNNWERAQTVSVSRFHMTVVHKNGDVYLYFTGNSNMSKIYDQCPEDNAKQYGKMMLA